MWFYGMDDLSSTMKGIITDTDSRIKLKSRLDSRVRVGSRVRSKSNNWISHSFPNNRMWLSKISGSCSSSIGIGISVGFGIRSESGKDTGVSIDSKSEIESQHWKSVSHSSSSSISLKWKLTNLSIGWYWSSSKFFGEIESWLKSPRYHDSSSIWLGESGVVENVLGRASSFLSLILLLLAY